MAKIRIQGKVSYQKLSGGFWGIIGNDGQEYRPVRFPEQLKYEGKSVKIVAKEVEEDMSIFMWGTPIKIVSFETMTP
ncbi:MAG: hypothetical protein AAF798_16605 [Bacteroidota bacterium]